MIEARLIQHEELDTNTAFWRQHGIRPTVAHYNDDFAVVVTATEGVGSRDAEQNLSDLLNGAEVNDVWVGFDTTTNSVAVILRADADVVQANYDTILDQFCSRSPERSTVEEHRAFDGTSTAVMAMYFRPTLRKLRVGVYRTPFAQFVLDSTE
jgi:hypothetical protein